MTMSDCGCSSLPTTHLMPVDEAIRRLKEAGLSAAPVVEQVALSDALGRVLASEIIAGVRGCPAP